MRPIVGDLDCLPDTAREVGSVLSGTVSEDKAQKGVAVTPETVSIGTTWGKPLMGWTALWSYKHVRRAPKLSSRATVYVKLFWVRMPTGSISAFDELKEVEEELEHRSQLVQAHFGVCAKWHMRALDYRDE